MANVKKTTEVRVPLTETAVLPSRGIPYGGEIPAEVKLRAMTTMDEKIRLSSSGLQAIVALLNACVVEPENFDASKLKMFDATYLTYRLRAVTYGSDYKVSNYCYNCNRVCEDIKIDIDSLPITEINEDFLEPFEIGPLPVSGDVLQCRLLSIGDIIDIDKESKRIIAKFKDYVGDPEMILGYAHMIYAVNGEVMPDFKKQNYVENMHGRDLMYFDSVYSNSIGNYGIDTEIVMDCPKCGETMRFELPMTDEFFRPRYNL